MRPDDTERDVDNGSGVTGWKSVDEIKRDHGRG
jgi:hypothetical protein